VLMVAPKGPGHTVRGEYQRGAGVPCPRLAATPGQHHRNAGARQGQRGGPADAAAGAGNPGDVIVERSHGRLSVPV